MEIILGFAVLVAVILFIYRRGVAEIDARDQDDTYCAERSEEKWKAVNFKWGEETGDPGWVALNGATEVRITGLNRSTGLAFVNQIVPGESVVELVREPSNPMDDNAIALYGTPNKTAMRLHLGYIPENLADEIAAEYSPELPIEAELRRFGWKDGGEDACFMAVNVLVPSANERKQYLIK